MRNRLLALSVAAVASVGLAASPAGAAPSVLRAELSGSQIPGPTGGDPDGSGQAFVVVDEASGRICVFLYVRDILASTGAHLHKGLAGQIGPHAVELTTPQGNSTAGASATCSTEPTDLLRDIAANPSGYYVNIHNPEFPSGALRSQLGR